MFESRREEEEVKEDVTRKFEAGLTVGVYACVAVFSCFVGLFVSISM